MDCLGVGFFFFKKEIIFFLHGFSAMFISVRVHPVFEDTSPFLINS